MVIAYILVVLTYLLSPWCRVLEKLTGLQLVKKFPAFHGTRRFITALTKVPHFSLSWASPIQSIYPHPTSCKSILILSTHLRLGLPSDLLPSGFPTKNILVVQTTINHNLTLSYLTISSNIETTRSHINGLLQTEETPSLHASHKLLFHNFTFIPESNPSFNICPAVGENLTSGHHLGKTNYLNRER